MLSKKVVKDIQSLGHKKFRDESQLFVAEGPKIVSELCNIIPSQVEAVYATEDWARQHSTVPHLETVSEEDLKRISQLKTPNQVVAVMKQFTIRKPSAEGFVIYLDQVQDPGNFGTIVRIADWFGVKDIVCAEGCADLYNPKVVQSTMASIARVNVHYEEESDWLGHQNRTIYAAALDGHSIYEMEKVNTGILIVGNESKGIRKELLEKAGQKITIPRRGEAESLNAAVATGIILSHLLI